jgi:hypothetical protein
VKLYINIKQITETAWTINYGFHGRAQYFSSGTKDQVERFAALVRSYAMEVGAA